MDLIFSVSSIKIKPFSVFFIFCLHLAPCYAQNLGSGELKLMTVLNSGSNSIPEDLQLSKTIVVISVDDNQLIRPDWKTLAEEAHYYLKKLNIDAVLYFYIDDLIAGYDVQRAITNRLNGRDIKNIFILSKDKINGSDQFIGVLTAYNQGANFISNNQTAWKSQTSDLEILFRNLARGIDNANLTLENLLIIDTPEFFGGIDIIRGKRFESFNTDLRIDRLAIPKFLDLSLPGNSEAESTKEIVALINKENSRNVIRNSQIENLMADYPYNFGIVPYEYDEKKLSAQGFQFVLMRIKSSGRNVRDLLGYQTTEDTNELNTHKIDNQGNHSEKPLPIDGMMYKYYIKHINSGEIYLGEQWDGDDSWQDALNNHLAALLLKLKK